MISVQDRLITAAAAQAATTTLVAIVRSLVGNHVQETWEILDSNCEVG